MSDQEQAALDTHRERHVKLHEALDELVADYLSHNRGRLPSDTTVMELIVWSRQQTLVPTEHDERSRS